VHHALGVQIDMNVDKNAKKYFSVMHRVQVLLR